MMIQANSLINAAIEDQTISKLGVVVMDELHMLDDESRGYIMELMATKLMSLEHNIQMIGMSASLSVSFPFLNIRSSFIWNDDHSRGRCHSPPHNIRNHFLM